MGHGIRPLRAGDRIIIYRDIGDYDILHVLHQVRVRIRPDRYSSACWYLGSTLV